MTAAKPRTRKGALAFVALYVLGRDGRGWRCRDCGREFLHGGWWKPRGFLALLDHTVLDHGRLPNYQHPGWAPEVTTGWNVTTATTATTNNITITWRHGDTFWLPGAPRRVSDGS